MPQNRLKNWRNRPIFIDYCPASIDYILFIDENGSCDLKNILKNIDKYKNQKDFLTITGVAIKTSNLKQVEDHIMNLKNNYWPNALFPYKIKDRIEHKRVCLHSIKIRKKQGPFSPKKIDYDKFIGELAKVIENIPITIFSSTINKVEHCYKYPNPHHPYSLCLNFIIERFVKFFLGHNESAIIVLEQRGKKEDKFILNHLKNLLSNGTNFVEPKYFKKIKGVYFNGKWSKDNSKTYFGLEIADICSYPIHKFVKHKKEDHAFTVLKTKIYNYPHYMGYGIKIFP